MDSQIFEENFDFLAKKWIFLGPLMIFTNLKQKKKKINPSPP